MGFLDRLLGRKAVNFSELVENGARIVDVRSQVEFASGSIKGAVNIPLQQFPGKLRSVSKEEPIILCCASGTRSGMARRALLAEGYQNVYNAGSWIHLDRKLKNGI